MADKKYTVIFNDNHYHDKRFTAGEKAELTEEQYNTAKGLFCGYDSSRPLITLAGNSNEPQQETPAAKQNKANG